MGSARNFNAESAQLVHQLVVLSILAGATRYLQERIALIDLYNLMSILPYVEHDAAVEMASSAGILQILRRVSFGLLLRKQDSKLPQRRAGNGRHHDRPVEAAVLILR